MSERVTRPAIPAVPQAWYYACGSHEIIMGARNPVGFTVAGREFVAYRTTGGKAVVLSGRCCHFESSLACGTIIDDCVSCAFHGWRFGPDGSCRFIPAGDPIPAWARQQSYPVTERYGQVFFFLGKSPRFELPHFEGVENTELIGCAPNVFHLKVPWYLVTANGFDMQHFNSGHERQPVGKPRLQAEGEHGLRIDIQLQNVGTSLLDRVAAYFAGKHINLSVVTIGGNSVAVTSVVKRTTTYGFVNIIPVSERECVVVNIVMVRRRRGLVHRLLLNRLNAWLRREFIRRFLSPEAPQLNGCDVVLARCQPADRELKHFLEWLSRLHAPNACSTSEEHFD